MNPIAPSAIAAMLLAAAPSGAATDDATEVPSEAKQKAIWDAEHATFEIETHFGARFLKAYRAREAKGLTALFRDDLKASAIASSAPLAHRSKSLASEASRSGDAGHRESTDAAGLAEALLAPFAQITEVEGARLRVLHIADNAPPDAEFEEWLTEVLITAKGKGKGGVLLAADSRHEVVFRAASDADYGSRPIVRSWQVNAERMRAAAQPLMEEVTHAAMLHRIPATDNWTQPTTAIAQRYNYQFAVADFDRDGFLDIATASVRGATALLKSIEGKQFAVANDTFGLPKMAHRAERALACWLDFDNDGFPDLILGDRVYRNRGGKKFEEFTTESGIVFPQSPNGCAVADYDGDGFCDLYVLYQGEGGLDKALPWVGDDISGEPNALWRSLGDGRFENVTEKAKASAGNRNSFAATWLYADGDALPDLYVANDFGTNNLLRNRGDGTFEDIAPQTGVADFATSMGVASGDLDNDGSPEIYVANMYSKMGRRIIAQVGEDDYATGVYDQIKGACAGNRLYRRGPVGGRYAEHSEPWGINDIGWAYAPAMADLDNDGLLDLYATTGFLSFERGKPDG